MKIIYNTVLPVVISPCKTWPNGRNLTAKNKGEEFIMANDKEGDKFLKTNLFIRNKKLVSEGIKIVNPKSINLDIKKEE